MKRNNAFPFVGILAGVTAIIFAIVLFAGGIGLGDYGTGSHTSYNYYGGDAYTGIQQAGADTANNVQSLARITRAGFQGLSATGFGFLLLVVGLGLIAFSLRALNENKVRDHFEEEVLNALKKEAAPVVKAEPEKKAEEIPDQVQKAVEAVAEKAEAAVEAIDSEALDA